MRSPRKLGLAVVAFTLCASLASGARAEEDAARVTARQLAEKGDAAFATGRCDRAIPLWKQADAAFAAPSIELRIAHCQALLNHVVDAAKTLTAIANHTLAPDAPEAFRSAQQQAASELPTVRARVATLQVVPPAGVAVTRVTVDEVEVPATKLQTFDIDPGRHSVSVTAGAATWSGPLELQDGEHRTVHVRSILEPGPEPSHTLRNVGLVVGGIGVAALATGTVMGIAALDKSKSLDADCGPSRTECPQDANNRITSVKTFSTLSDVLLGSGVVLAGVGVYMIIRDARQDRAPGKMRITVGARGVGLSATF
ncbi:MAG: hypothetical protein ABI551_14640 [Polyangiaceae bacterium]